MEVRQVLECIQATQTQDQGKGPMQRSTEEGDKNVEGDEETIQMIMQPSPNFSVTQDMLQIEEEITQNSLKYLEKLKLVLVKKPTKALYKLQVNVTQEVQS
jgi:hypothetical protein